MNMLLIPFTVAITITCCLMKRVIVVADCPDICECANESLVCLDWSSPFPPVVQDVNSYTYLDLSSQHTLKVDSDHHCLSSKRAAKASRRSVRGRAAGLEPPLGAGLERGRLPAAWLGNGRFVWLRVLRLRGAGLRLIHKDALRGQLKLQCVDVSANLLQRVNVFTWHRHTALRTLIMNENPHLELPQDAPFFYSKSLENIFLSSCNLLSLNELTFSEMPKLRNIDLSGNQLTTLGLEFSHSLLGIMEVDLTNNQWICDCSLKEIWEDMKKTNQVWIQAMDALTCSAPEQGTWSAVFASGCRRASPAPPPPPTLIPPREAASTRPPVPLHTASSRPDVWSVAAAVAVLLGTALNVTAVAMLFRRGSAPRSSLESIAVETIAMGDSSGNELLQSFIETPPAATPRLKAAERSLHGTQALKPA